MNALGDMSSSLTGLFQKGQSFQGGVRGCVVQSVGINETLTASELFPRLEVQLWTNLSNEMSNHPIKSSKRKKQRNPRKKKE